MSKEKIDLIVDGGKATAGASMGKALGPLKINVQDVLSVINEKTAAFVGVKVPIKIIVDTKTKEFNIEVGSPPVSELIKKELGLEKGSSQPNQEKIANLSMEQVIKIALMKKDSMLDKTLKSAVKSVIGSCNSLGCLVESKISIEINKDIDEGIYDDLINSKKIETSPEKLAKLKEELKLSQERAKAKAAAEKEKEKPKEEAKEEGEEKKEEPKKEEAKKEVKKK